MSAVASIRSGVCAHPPAVPLARIGKPVLRP